MATKPTTKTKLKRLPKGVRAHIRRLKQEADKEGTALNVTNLRRSLAK